MICNGNLMISRKAGNPMVSKKAPGARPAKTEEWGALIGAQQRRNRSAPQQTGFLRDHHDLPLGIGDTKSSDDQGVTFKAITQANW